MAIGLIKTLGKPIAFGVLGFLFFYASGQQVEIIYEGAVAKGVRCTGCSEEVTVRLTDATDNIIGRVESSPESIVFYGVLPFDSGLSYELWDEGQLIETFRPRTTHHPSTKIEGIFPQSDLLPVNLLKMHVVFSGPMAVDDSYQYIHFYRADEEIFPLLHLQPELWNKDRTILTLWLDPGRIKRDLLRQKELGAPLVEDEEYLMVIDSTWRDGHGNRLNTHATKQFRTATADRTIPSVGSWELDFPEEPIDALSITFDEAIDYLLLHHAIHVRDSKEIIPGTVSISENQKQWRFEPQEPWSRRSKYQLIVESRLEDLAGNNLHRPFDRDIQQTESEEPKDVVFSFQLSRK